MNGNAREAPWASPPVAPILLPDEVQVWRIPLEFPPVVMNHFRLFLSEEEQQRAERFYFEKHRRRYIAAHGALRVILGRYLGIDPRAMAFTTNAFGKPSDREDRLRFNLSHSHEMALIAITLRHEIGVDIERIRDDIELESIAEQFFSAEEYNRLVSLPIPHRVPAFFHCWTRKEAFIKAKGMGLSLPLDQFDVSIDPEETDVSLHFHTHPEEEGDWSLRVLDPDPAYAAALAVAGDLSSLRCRTFTP